MIKLLPRHPAPVWLLALSAFMLLSLPLRAETLRGPGGLPPGLVAAMLGRMQGKALDARGCARLGDLRGCFGREGARFRGAGKEIELRAVAWGREGGLEKLRWKSVGEEGSREVYRGRGIEGWWRAVPLGYEEGFELMRRPRGWGPVEVELEANRVGRKVGGGIRWGEVRYGKLWVTDARGRRVPAVLREEGRKVWIRIEGRGWKYPLRVDPLVWLEQAATLPAGLGSGSYFGRSVALSGNGEVAIVGAPGVNGNTGAAYGYTYDSSTGTWGSPMALSVPSGAGDFGASVALSSDGTVALIAANFMNGGLGAAYVYTYDSGTKTWSSTPVTLSPPSGVDDFGSSVALSGNGEVALVGAIGGAGAAYVYTYSGGTWGSPVALSVPSGADDFGASVALSGNGEVALVGAPFTNNNAGAVYVYTSSTEAWSSTSTSGPVTLSAPSGVDDFGSSVSLSSDGTVALVGAPTTSSDAGAVYVYTSSTEAWSSVNGPVTLSAPSGEGEFGYSVSLSSDGTVALVGAPTTNSGAGAAYVYTYSGGTWSSPVELFVPIGGEEFGLSVALSSDGTVALVGTFDTNTGSGEACVYTSSTEAWSSTSTSGPVLLLAPSGPGEFGSSVALSSDGTVALVASPYVYANSGIGAAYVYTYDSSMLTWGSPVTLPVPSGALKFGYSVALSSDVTEALVGAPNTNNYQGSAYFYGAADLDLVLAAPSAAAAGEQYTEQSILTNVSNYASSDLTLNLPIPVGTNYQDSSVTFSTQGSCTTSLSSGVVSSVSCDVGSLAANGGSSTVSVTLAVPSNTTAGTEIAETTNLANATPSLSTQATTAVAVAPTVSGLAEETVTVGETVPSESFTIGGTGMLTVSASSSNTALLPDSGITVSSGCDTSGASCTLTLAPVTGQVGTTAVTVTVGDGYGQVGSESFSLTVVPPGAPTLSGLTNETVTVGKTVPPESFTITGLGALTVSANSSNTVLLPDSGIGGYSGCTAAGSCTLTLTPVSGQVGTAAVTVTVEDGYGEETSTSFALTVQSSAPVVSGLEDISMAVGGPAAVEDFTVSGVGPLSVETQTTNAALLPEAFIEVSPGCGSGSGEVVDRCTLTLSPTAGMTGGASVLVTVTDAEGRSTTGLVTLYVEPSLGSTSGGTSGGGSVGVGMLLGLLVLVGFRKRKLRRESV